MKSQQKLDVLVHYVLPWELHISGFSQRLANLEKGHGKVMEHEKLAKSHGIFLIKFVFFLVTTKKLSSDLESLHFQRFSAKRRECKMVMENKKLSWEKSWTNILSSLWEPSHIRLCDRVRGYPHTRKPCREKYWRSDITWYCFTDIIWLVFYVVLQILSLYYCTGGS